MSIFKKRSFAPPFLLIFSTPWLFEQHDIFYYIGPLLAFVFVPLFDFIVGKDESNPTNLQLQSLEKERYFKILTICYVPLQFIMIGYGAYHLVNTPMNTFQTIGFILTLSLYAGIFGIPIAHELGHKNTKLERGLSQILLTSVSYAHFYIEHNKGHHVNVGTLKDPATALLNESFYMFYSRTVIGSFKSAWAIEARRLKSKGRSPLSVRNKMLWYLVAPVLLASLYSSFGLIWNTEFSWLVFSYFFLQSIIAFSILEVINYIEHYGLKRAELKPGQFETVNELHSWNANDRLTNAFLFHLQRHSDHHAYAQRRYQSLRHFNNSPQLPTGYAGMLLLALVPPLWFRVMNPKVKAFYNGELETDMLHVV